MRLGLGLLMTMVATYLVLQSSERSVYVTDLLLLDDGGLSLLKLLLGFSVLISVVYISFLDWRRALKSVFLILVFDGAVRKWLLPQASDLIYFFKDFVLLGAYLRYFFFSEPGERLPLRNNILNILILIAGSWCIFQAFNPRLGSPIVGLLGLKAYLFYLPTIWMIPRLFRSQTELYVFIRNHLLLLIPIGLLGVVQFFSPPDHLINQYIPGRDEPIATFGFAGSRNVRVTSTFSYLNSYQGYLSACFGLLIPLLNYPQSRLWRNLTFCELVLAVVNMLMTGSRTPVIVAAGFTLGYFGLRLLHQPQRALTLLSRLILYSAIALSVIAVVFRPVITVFWKRLSAGTDLAERIASNFSGPFQFSAYTHMDGFGIGATHPGAMPLRYLLGLPFGEPLPVELEIEMDRVALELGPIGFIFWYGLRLYLILVLWLTYLKLKQPFLRDLALAGFLMHAMTLSNHMVFHHTFSTYYWFYASFVYLLPWLEQVATWQREQQWLQYYASLPPSLPDAPHG